MESSIAVPLTGLITMQGVQMFSNHAPPIRQLRKAHKLHDKEIMAELRVAEIEAASVMVLAGVAISAMTGSPAPAYLSIATTLIMIGVYEWTLAQTPVTITPNPDTTVEVMSPVAPSTNGQGMNR